MTLQTSMENRTELGVKEWRDSLFLRYVQEPPDLPHYCDGCNTNFSIYHSIVKRAALLRRVITSSVEGFWTCPEKHSPPLTCATTPSSSQVEP